MSVYRFGKKKNIRNSNWLVARTEELKKRNALIVKEYSKEKTRSKILHLAQKYSLTSRQVYNIIDK